MSIFGTIMEKIFHSGQAAASPATQAARAAAVTQATTPADAAAPDPAAPVTQAPVDVDAVLTAMATQKGGGGNWRSSIVDLLKLLDLDSSLSNRKQLGAELGMHAGADSSAEENIALHRAVMQKLAENGGKVPESLRQ